MNCDCVARHGETFWRTREGFTYALETHAGVAFNVATEHGISYQNLSVWRRRLGLPQGRAGSPRSREIATTEVEDDKRILAALKKLGDSASLLDLAEHADLSPKLVKAALGRLGHDGHRVETDEQGTVKLQRVPIVTANEHKVLFRGSRYKFGVITDVHLGSKHCRLDELHIAYDMVAELGIDTVYNCGDIVCGKGVFPGQLHEVELHTYEDQVAYAAEHYPARDGVTTKLIGGNHDLEGDFARAGADAALAVANRRPDIEYCGAYDATFELPQGTRITLRHPKGGKGYAKSYKPQKFAESFEGGTKPHVLIFGHWHSMGYFMERNIHILMGGTFESGGTLGLRLPLGSPAVGFWTVEMTVAKDGSVVEFQPTWRAFFAGRRADTL